MMQNDKNRRGTVDEEVQKLFRKSKVSQSDFQRLRQRYDDVELADRVQDAFVEKQTKILKRAKKFAQLIRNKYSDTQYPFHILLEKAKLFKVKYGLSDDEFAEFQRIYEQELLGLRSDEVLRASTNMSKILGNMSVEFQGFANKLNENDYKVLQEILKVHASTRTLHAQIMLQSIQYEDCANETLAGTFHRELGHRVGDHVHPVIAALFLPKIGKLESHFLYSNLAGIVKSRYNGEPLNNRPDYELFYSLTTDPNDVVCDNRSPMSDLLNRVQLQVQLWNNVLNLRNANFFNPSSREFIATVDMCRLNKHDTPDFIYGRYDGTITKRLLAAFSFRPTIVSTSPIVQNYFAMNPYAQHVARPVVTAIPMINLRLLPIIQNNQNKQGPVSLKDATSQEQFFLENGVPQVRFTNIIWSNGVLVFFVDRRAHVIKYTDLPHLSMSRMPLAISGFERINNTPVEVDNVITLSGGMSYKLRSVVVAESSSAMNSLDEGVMQTNTQIVIGSSTIIRRDTADQLGEYIKYDPLSVVNPNANPVNVYSNANVGGIPGGKVVCSPLSKSDAEQKIKDSGIVFIYEGIETDETRKNGIFLAHA